MTDRNGHTDVYKNVNYQPSGNYVGAIPQKTLGAMKSSRTVTTNTITYGMRTVTPIQFIDKIDTRTMGIDNIIIGMDFKTSDVDENIRADNSNFITMKDVKCKWKDNFRDDYTSAFNIDNIQRVN